MGSNQSSQASKGPQSFSIDPSGNITRRVTPPVASPSEQVNKQTTMASLPEHSDKSPQHTTTSIDQAFTSAVEEPVLVAAIIDSPELAIETPAPPKDADLSLAEAEQLVDSIQARYKQLWAPDQQAAGNQMTAQELERKIVQCYRSNSNQTMNCSAVYKNYQDYVLDKRAELLRSKRVHGFTPQLVTTVLVVITCLLLHLSSVHCLGAMSVDLGSEWMKVGLVAPSVQMDIVLNAQSQRKTPMAIGFSNGERYIGEPALDVAGKYPERVYTHFVDLLGKETLDHPSVLHYKTRFPYAKISNPPPASSPSPPTTDNNSTTNTAASKSVILNHPEGLEFTPLELVAMMLQHAHDQVANVLKTSDQVATDVVITVPPYFNLQERQLVEDAAKLAGLNVLRLTNSNSAFALSYGIFRHHEYLPRTSDNKTTILFFDQGASQTSATLADYHLLEQQQQPTTVGANPTNESLPTITVRAQVFDRYMGGFDMQLKIRDHLLANFCKLNKVAEAEVRSRGRSISKLLKEAGRVKKILSANTDHTVRVENVINDIDLKQFITRKEFEELNKEYLEDRIVKLLDRLFEMPDVSREERIESVIIVGGNTRTPKIQQTLLEYFKLQTLGKSINGDEGAAMAALYQAASHGRGFRVKKFVLEEFNSTLVDGSTSVEVIPTDSQTFEASRVKLSQFREKDQMRLERLSLKNALESILSEAREKLNAENPDDNLKEVKDKLEKEVKDSSEWLEEGPVEETNNITTLTDKLRTIQELLHPPPPLGLDPNFLNLSREQLEMLKNKTMGIMSKLNLPNPFSTPENETVGPEDINIEPPETKGATDGSTPPPTINPDSNPNVGPPPRTDL